MADTKKVEKIEKEITELASARTGTKISQNLTSVVLIRPFEDGGTKREKFDTKGMDLSRCRWAWQGKREVILTFKNGVYQPVTRPERAPMTANAMYDVNNPNALHNCWKPKMTGLQKIAVGVMAVLTVVLFILAFVWIKGNGGSVE